MAEELIEENRMHFIISYILHLEARIEYLKEEIENCEVNIKDLADTKWLAMKNMDQYSTIPEQLNLYIEGGLGRVLEAIWQYNKRSAEHTHEYCLAHIGRYIKELKEMQKELKESVKLLEDFKRFEPEDYKRIFYE